MTEQQWTIASFPELFSGPQALKVVPTGEDRFNNLGRLVTYGSIGAWLYRGRESAVPLGLGLVALGLLQLMEAVPQQMFNSAAMNFSAPQNPAGPAFSDDQVSGVGTEQPQDIPRYELPQGSERPVDRHFDRLDNKDPVRVRGRANIKRRPPRAYMGRNAQGKHARFGIRPGVMDPAAQELASGMINDVGKPEQTPAPVPKTPSSIKWLGSNMETFPSYRALVLGAKGVPTQLLLVGAGEAPRPNPYPKEVAERHLRFPGQPRPQIDTGNVMMRKAAGIKKRNRVAWD